MYVITAVPLIRGTPLDELSYFTVRQVSVGDIIHAPLRGTEVPMIVTKVTDAASEKSTLRSQSFELQKIGASAPSPLVGSACIEACFAAASYHACSVGSVLHTILPQVVIEEKPARVQPDILRNGSYQALALQETFAERVITYKNIVRESIARQESLLIVCPRRIIAERLAEALSKGIEHYVELIHGGLSRKKMLEHWSTHATNPAHKIIIGTYQAFAFPMHKLGTIIVESESDDAFQLIERPHVDIRIFAQQFAKASHARVLFADTMLRVKTFQECERGYREYYTPPLHKVRSDFHLEWIQKKHEERGYVFTDQLLTTLTELITRKKKILVLVARKGIATSVWCTDCGTMLRCPHCKATVRLVKGGESGDVPVLACMRCGHTESSHTTCPKCSSWKLKNYGFPIDAVTKHATQEFPDTHITSIDNDSHTEYETKKALSRVFESDDAEVILATPSILAYGCQFDATIIQSLESFAASPQYGADETTFRMCMKAKELTLESFTIQSQKGSDERLGNALTQGEITTFLKSELELRTALKLPPEVLHIVVKTRGKRASVIEDVRTMLELVKSLRPRPFKELTRISPHSVEHTTIIRVPATPWPDEATCTLIKSIDPVFDVRIQAD